MVFGNIIRIIIFFITHFNGFIQQLKNTIGPSIAKTKDILNEIKLKINENRIAFSNFNIVRMREAIRYFTPQKLNIFIKIPFLLHINDPDQPGYIDSKTFCHGIWNFEASGFFKEAIKSNLIPKSIFENKKLKEHAIEGVYHIGSLGTFTQSIGSDFDYWVIIDKKRFSKERYDNLEKKLDSIVRYSREEFDQEVTFFIMDKRDIKRNCYAPFEGEETLTAPKLFLKEEFYRTFLMIAGKIPVWFVLPTQNDLLAITDLNSEGIKAQVLSLNEDLIDLGQIDSISLDEVMKGLLWQICKSKEDSVKAIIKATMVFSYGFSTKMPRQLLCEKIKKEYSKAGIDDYSVDPYKALFDQILRFHELEDPKALNLVKNAIFFRLCEYPAVKMPGKNTPKWQLLNKYITSWKLNKNQISKLLSYTDWSESEKLVLERSFINRLAQMFNSAIKITGKINPALSDDNEKRNWKILRNKIRERLRKDPRKIPESSIYIKRRNLSKFEIKQDKSSWVLNMTAETGQMFNQFYRNNCFLGVVGWILENQIYKRQKAAIHLNTSRKIFKSTSDPVEVDKLYMAFQPLKPLSDTIFETDAVWSRMMVFLVYENDTITKAEFLISNTWGELFIDSIELATIKEHASKCTLIAETILKHSSDLLRFFIYQFSNNHDPEIVYQIKKTYNDLASATQESVPITKRPYLDKL